MKLDKRELATVLAALRFYSECWDRIGNDINEIASDGGNVEPLYPDEIDALCERLNTEGAGPVLPVLPPTRDTLALDALSRALEGVEGVYRDARIGPDASAATVSLWGPQSMISEVELDAMPDAGEIERACSAALQVVASLGKPHALHILTVKETVMTSLHIAKEKPKK